MTVPPAMAKRFGRHGGDQVVRHHHIGVFDQGFVHAVKDVDVREQDRPGGVLSSGRQADARGKRKRHDGYHFLN